MATIAGRASPGGNTAPARSDNPIDDRPLLESRRTGVLIGAVMAVSIVQFLDATIANVALPHMATALGASPDTITWVLTSFIISGVLVLPLVGWLSDRLGSRNVFIGSTALFVIASMLCGTATSLTQMVFFRGIQGAASAFMGPLCQTILLDLSRPSKQAQAMSLYGIVVMIGPISGPVLGGLLTENFNWRWVFYVNVPIGVPALAVLWWLLPSREKVQRRLDVFGATVLALGLASLQLMLDRGEHNDWFESRETLVELLVALSAFWVFLIHTMQVAHPLFNGAMVRNRNFLVGLLFMAVLGVTNVALSSLLPTMYETLYGYSVVDTGFLMAPRGIGMLVTMFAVNRLIRWSDPRLLITIGYAIAALSMYSMTAWSLDMDWHPIVVSAFIQGLGLGLVFVPVNLLSFATLDQRYRPEGATLMTLFRNLGASFGISASVTMMGRNLQTSHADVASNVTSFSIPGIDPASSAAQLGQYGGAALQMLNAEVTRQAGMIAYLDNFKMMFILLLVLAPLAYVLRRPMLIGQRQRQASR